MAAALLGAAVELLGYRPEFSRPEEPPLETLARLRPSYVLIDGGDPAARDISLLGRGLMRGTRMAIVGRRTHLDAVRELAQRYDIPLIALPEDTGRLEQFLSRRSADVPQAERDR